MSERLSEKMVHKRFLGCLAVALITMTGCDQEQPIEMDTTTAASEEQKQSGCSLISSVPMR